MGGAGNGRFGVVLSQMIFDRLRSTGAITTARRKMAKNAMPNMSNMTIEMMIASKMTGMAASIYSISWEFFRLSGHYTR